MKTLYYWKLLVDWRAVTWAIKCCQYEC